jgi:hypothetical protein
MTDLEIHQPHNSLSEQMRYAATVAQGSLLPQAYRNKPADILIALGLGQAMGLSPAESLYRIDVIQGKPTASAELIAANVRKAGHILRVRVDESVPSATATIIRADDPGYEHTVVRDAAWAKRMGLDSKDNYRKQPATMLQWRAITGVARLACPEALYGVAYTSDEMADVAPTQTAPRVTAETFMRPAEPEPVDAEPEPDEPQQPETDQAWTITPQQITKVNILLKAHGYRTRPEALAHLSSLLGRDVDSTKHLTKDEASGVIDELDRTTPAELDEVPA